MKKIALLLLLPLGLFAQQWQTLGNPQFVTVDENFGFCGEDIASANGNTFISFVDEDSNFLSVMRLVNGTWEYVGTPSITEAAGIVELKITDNNIPYVAFDTNSGIKVMCFDNNSWITIFNNTQDVFSFDLDNNDIPYITTLDENNNQLVTQKYNGSFWEELGNPIQLTTEYDQFALRLSDNNTPYIAFNEDESTVSVNYFENNTWVSLPTLEVSDGYFDLEFAGIFDVGPGNIPHLACTKELEWEGDVHIYKYLNQNWESIPSPFSQEAAEGGIGIKVTDNNVPYILYDEDFCSDDFYPNDLIMKKYINEEWVDVGLNCFGYAQAIDGPNFEMDQYGIYFLEKTHVQDEYSLTTLWYPLGGVNMDEEKENTSKELLKIVDVLGRNVKPTANTPLFYIYQDGSMSKQFIIE